MDDPFDKAPEVLLALSTGEHVARLLEGSWSTLPGWTRVESDLDVWGGSKVIA